MALGASGAQAQEAGDWMIRAGAWNISPKSDNSDIVNVDAGQSLGFNFTYFVNDRFAVEVLASLPFSHNINLNAAAKWPRLDICRPRSAPSTTCRS